MNKAEQLYLEQFKEWLIIKGYSGSTIQSLTKTTAYFIEWITEQTIEAEQVSYNDVLAYINHKRKNNNKPRTLQLMVGALNQFYNFLQSEHGLKENPISNIKIKGIKRKSLHEILTPEELETLYKTYNAQTEEEITKSLGVRLLHTLSKKRNKIILGLIIYQGLKTEEVIRLELQDLQLREGKITIQGSVRTEKRILKLEAHQVYDLMDYIHVCRKQLLELTGKQSIKVFMSTGASANCLNMMHYLIASVRHTNPKIKDHEQLRASVICNWLKVYNLRKVQYMAGHRYVSSTEAYQVNNMEELQEDIKKYHPIG